MNKKLSILIIMAGGLLVTACNNKKTNKDTSKTDSAGNPVDAGSHRMNDTAMQGNDLMKAMHPMTGKMDTMAMSGDFDRDFASMMIEHHQGAIDMSKIELAKGTDEKMRAMAQRIINAQTGEIIMLREILQNFKPSGMVHGKGELQKIHSDMKLAMEGAAMTGNMDKDFALMMIPHHEGAVKMFRSEQSNGMNATLKQFAEKGIADQEGEITELEAWLKDKK